MKRLHVHVSVDNLADSIKFYSGMFAAEPTVAKSDYAKWHLEDPRMNFAISRHGAKVGLDHLGIQVESDAELAEMQSRLDHLEPGVKKEEGAACCYARSDKYWLTDPSGIAWETFHTLESIPVYGVPKRAAAAPIAFTIPVTQAKNNETACCAPTSSKQGSSCC
ncbi:MAG: Lactoylglutathione lyase [Burkholderia sp.]|nr:Lactoylglutathione lyase [Burkholderia sp.]